MKKPFHESIVKTIPKAKAESEMVLLADLIKSTVIPKWHNVIIDVWTKRTKELGVNDYSVTESILNQKNEHDPVDWKKLLDLAKTLEEALNLGFKYMPLNSSYIGPKKLIRLSRSCIENGSPEIAEITVRNVGSETETLICYVCWGNTINSYNRADFETGKLEMWNDKW